MKKFLLLLTLLCTLFSFSTANATEVTIGDLTDSGTDANSNIPFSSYYKYGFSQQIYTADEITAAGGGAGTINSLTLWMYNTSNITEFPITIYMAEVSDTAFATTSSWCTLTASNLVYSGTLMNLPTTAAAVDAVEITLETPFTYSGTGNLLIAIANNTGSWNSGFNCMAFGPSSGAYLTLYKNQDSGAIDPTNPGSITGTRLTKRNVIQLDITTSGPVIQCDKPETVEVNDVTAHTATVNWTGGSGTYNVQYKAAGATDWTFAGKNLTSTSIALSNLVANTSYSVQVQSVCGENTSGWKSASSFSTLIDLPYEQDFSKSSIPTGWSQYSGKLNADGSFDSSKSSTYSWVFGASNGVFDSHAKLNICGTSTNKLLVTPAIPMKANQQLSFDLALTKYSGTLQPIVVGSQADDKFAVLASIDGGNNWVTLREWNNSGSAYVYDNIVCSAEGEGVVIDLSAYGAGQTILLAFYGESSASGGDNNLHIDNVAIENVPSCYAPQDLAEVPGRTTKNSTQLAWTAVNGETAWLLQYKKDTAKTWIDLGVDVTENPYTLTGLEEFTEYNIRVAAKCDASAEDGISKYTKAIKIKTASGLPFHEGFSGTALPAAWKRYTGLWEEVQSGEELTAATAGWDVKSVNGVFPDSAKHLVLTLAGNTGKHWLVSPLISMEAGQQLTFDLALTKSTGTTTSAPTAVTPGSQASQKFIVAMSQDGGASWDEIGKWDNSDSKFDGINATASGQIIKIVLNDSLANKNVLFAFYGESTGSTDASNNLHISNVLIDDIPACENSTSLNITDIMGTSATATWDNEEGAVWQYYCKANAAENFVPSDSNYIDTIARTVSLTGLMENTTYTVYLRKKCGLTHSDFMSRTFTTIQTPASLPYNNDFETGNGWYLINGTPTNKWAWGEATNNTKNGSHALYISNDNGISNKYAMSTGNAAMVYATKTFFFGETGMYLFQFDWRAYGYSTTDYMRVALVPADLELTAGTTTPSGFTSSALPTGWTALDGGSKLNLDSIWKTQTTELAIEEVGYYKVVFAWRNGATSYSKNPPAAIDNIKISRIACPKPTGLEIADISALSATLSWTDEVGAAWEYAYALDTAAAPTEFTSVSVNSVALSGLEECTSYKFYLRKVCGADGNSEVISLPFQTLQNPVEVGKIFTDGFESANGWLFVNGDRANAWTIGTAAHNGDGSTHALYISDDNGAHNTYTNEAAMVFATKSFTFADASYIFQYDWKAWGESTWDFIRVALAPADTKLTAGSTLYSGLTYQALPSTWKALDGGSKLNLDSAAWTTHTTGEIDLTAGDYIVVFAWRNDGSGGANPPAAIDNFSIRKVLCATPANLSVDSVTTTSALLKWEPQATESTWLIRYKESGAANWADTVQATSDSTWLANLEPSTLYEVQVASWCDPTDDETISEFTASVSFATECVAYDALNEHFDSLAVDNSVHVLPVCWDFISTSATYAAYPTAYNTEKAYSASNVIYFLSNGGSSNDPQDEYLILPEMTSLDGMRLKFQARKEDETDENITIKVGVMTDKTDTATFVVLDTIPLTTNVYSPVVVPFTGYTGEGKYIAIMMPAAASSWATTLIDNVVVEEIPQCVEPSTLHVDTLTASSVVLRWSQQGSEENWLIRYKKSGAEAWADTILASTDSLIISGLKKATTYEAQIAAWCDLSDEEAVSPFSGSILFTTDCGAWSIAEDGNYVEGFEAYEGVSYSSTYGVVPTCWQTGGTSTYAAPHVVTSGTYAYVHNGTKALNFCASANSYCYAALPLFEEPISALQINFWTKMESATNGTLSLGYITENDQNTFHTIVNYTNVTTMTEYETILDTVPAAAYRLVFMWSHSGSSYYSCCIDDITVSPIPTCFKPTDLEAVLTPINGSVATLNWKPGKNETAWVVEYSRKANFSDSIQVAVQDSTANLTGLMSDSTYYARVKAVCSETDESAWSNAISFTPTDALIINDSTATNSYMPFYGYYVNQDVQGQFIIPESQLAPIMWDSITQLTFYSSTASAAWTNAQFEVYMAQTSDSTMSAMTDWSKMDKVMDSTHLAVTNNQMKVTLTEPYQYQGGNLLVGIRLVKKASSGTTVYWYGKPATGASISGYKTSATATALTSAQRNFLPKLKIAHVHGEEPSCIKVTDLKVSGRTASSAVIGWTNGDTIQSAWQIAYSTVADFNPGEVTPLDVQSNPYTLSELLTDTAYYVYVRANCGDEGYSQWSKPISFRTAKACQLPDEVTVATSVSSATVSWNTYGQTGFNLRYTKDGKNWIDSMGVASPFTINGLEPNTTYSVKVQAACDTAAWTVAKAFKTVRGMPLDEKFATSTLPTDWAQYSGLLSKVMSGATSLTSGTAWYFGTSNGVFNSHARNNVYGTSRYHWLVTPAVYVEGDVQLTFDLALTAYSGTTVPAPDTTGTDDKFVVLISENNGASWSILRQWDNAGSEYVYNNIANTATGEQVVLGLQSYSGKSILVAFYAESTVSNADNNLHIDNVLIDIVPTCLKPKAVNVANVRAHTAQVHWTIGEEGQTAWQIAYDTLASNKPDTLPNMINANDTSYVLSGLDPSTTYYVYVRANCGDEDGLSRWSDVQSFTTTIPCPAPTNLKAELTPGNGSVATLKWKAGGDEASWIVEYSRKANLSDSIVVLVEDTTCALTGLTADSTYYARVKADCGVVDSLSAYTSIISFTPNNRYELLVNDGTKTNAFVPIYGQWVDDFTRSQFIIPETALESIEWDSITQLTFYASNDSVDWGAAEFQIYMAEAPEATLSELADWASLRMVADSASLSIYNKQMVVTLDAPYQYQGGNLLIGFYQTVSGDYASATWYGTTATGASFGGYGDGNNVSQRNFLPKMLISYVPGIEPPCTKARHLKVSEVTDYEAVIKWDAYEGATWQYALIKGDTLPVEADYIDHTADTIALSGLDDESDYVFYLRKACGADGNSPVVSVAFKTLVHVEEVPFEDDFEGAKSAWKLINGTSTNAWTIGSAAGEGKALYISNDGGTTNAYTFDAQTAVYATLLVDIKEAAMYAFSYNWKANGEYSEEDQEAYDYLRVALAPDTATLTAKAIAYEGLNDSTLPTGWLPLDGGKALLESTQWKRNSVAYDLAPGQYKVVIAWINDDEDGNNMPAAIDNFRVIQNDCHQPTALTASNITPVSATLSWSDGDDTPMAWQIAYSMDDNFIPDSVAALDVALNPYELAGLNEEVTYHVAVRVNCGEGDFSPWSEIFTFTTLQHCDVMSQDEEQDSICPGETYLWNGMTLDKAGVYYDTLPNASASRCDSIVTLVLSYYASEDTIFVTDTINEDDLPYIYQADYIEGQAYISYPTTTVPGTYMDTALVHGEHCAAALVLTLTVEPRPCQDVTLPAEKVSICQGDSYTWRGKSYEVSGLYYDTVPTLAGCDSIFVLNLSYYAPEDTIFVAETIRVNELPYTYEADYIAGQAPISYAEGTAVGIYNDTALVHGAHCTAVLVHMLTIKEACQTAYAEPEVVISCDGKAYEWHGVVYSASGIYYDTLQTAEGCDSIATLDLTVVPAQDPLAIVIEKDTICPGDSYSWHGEEYTEAGLYADTLQSIYGCDSIVKLELSLYEDEAPIFMSDTIDESDLPYTLEDVAYATDQLPIHFDLGTEPGEYHETALVHGENCIAELNFTLVILKSQDIDNIYGRDGKKVQKVLYNDIMYIVIDDEWYSTAGQKVQDPRK